MPHCSRGLGPSPDTHSAPIPAYCRIGHSNGGSTRLGQRAALRALARFIPGVHAVASVARGRDSAWIALAGHAEWGSCPS